MGFMEEGYFMNKPTILIPIGDVAGVGPEIVAKALGHREIYEVCNPVAVGEKSCMERAVKVTNEALSLHCIEHVREAARTPGTVDLIDLHNIDAEKTPFGRVQAHAGQAAYEFIEKSVRMVTEGQGDALATTTINKEALKAANIPYIGHTEILAGLLNVSDPMTMFQVKNLKVFFLTRHLSLLDAIRSITREGVYHYIHRCHDAMHSLGIPNPRIAIAGLNPHSGEHGLFGTEEMVSIAPAVEDAQRDGIHVTGPIGADSVFYLALKGNFDAVISLYHDQGHIATKMVDFERTISLTIGLPFLRTSVDHGTAFDIAGKNLVSEISMVEAIRLATYYAPLYDPAFVYRKK